MVTRVTIPFLSMLVAEDLMDSTEKIASSIVAWLRDTPTHTIRGAGLAEFIKHSFPGFTPLLYQCRNFREFIHRYVPEVIDVGRAGMDVIYGLQEVQEASINQPAPILDIVPAELKDTVSVSAEAFQAFKSPNAPFNLLVNLESRELRVQPIGAAYDKPWVRIAPCSPQIHASIAKDFLSEVNDESHRTSLGRILDGPAPAWWIGFGSLVRQFGLGAQWGAFRRHRLLRELEEALNRAGLPVKGAILLRVPLQTPRRLEAPIQSKQTQLNLPESETSLRSLVMKVLDTASIAELRALRLPLGDVLDALRRG